jgi:hypothetical protein
MSKQEKGRLYASEEPQGLRMDNWDEDSKEGKGNKDPKKLAKKLRNRGGRTFVLDKTKGKRGEYREV